MNLTLNKNGHEYSVTVNEDFSATIDGKLAKFDPLYNAVILNDGYLIEETFVNGLRLDSETVKKINNLHEGFKKNYESFMTEQKAYTPEIVKLVGEKFVYDSPFEFNVATSETIEKLNLLVEGDQRLIQKIVADLMDTDGIIQTRDLIKLPEYKEYVVKLRKYDKIRKKQEEKRLEYEQFIIGKQKVGMYECNSCNELFIVGDENAKYLKKVTFFDAKNEWLSYSDDENQFKDFCLGVSDNFVFLKIGNADNCKMCEL